MTTLIVAGCGLLGTSVVAAHRRAEPDALIVGIEPDPSSRLSAEHLGLFTTVVESAAAAKNALLGTTADKKVAGQTDFAANENENEDVIGVVATPPAVIAQTLLQLAPFCTLVMDVGSIKAPIIEELEQRLVNTEAVTAANIVPCHPMAGSHKRGPQAGMATLFDGRWVFIVPMRTSGDPQIQAAHQFWRNLGAHTSEVDAVGHDKAVAHTSHLPHLLASAYMEVQTPNAAAAGTGFMDFTRLAKANPEMWSQVLVANQRAWRPLLQRYIEVLQQADKLVESGDTEAVERWLEARLDERLSAEQPTTP